MPAVRITGNYRDFHKMEWLGNPSLDDDGNIERSIDIPEEAYAAIEEKITKGYTEGTINFDNGHRFDYFVDR